MENEMDEQAQKRVAFYSNLVNAWIQTRMEADKTLIVISSGGIGFLITLLTIKGVTSTTDLIVYLVAFFSFFLTIVICVVIFGRNSSYIKTLLNNPDAKDDAWLSTLDYLAKAVFGLALIFTLIIGVSTGFDQLYKNRNSKGGIEEMADSKAKEILKRVDESFKDLGKLNPDKIDEMSLGGLGKLAPDKNTGTTSTNTGTTTQSTTDNTSNNKKS